MIALQYGVVMSAITPDQLSEIARTLTLCVLVCCLIGWWIGGALAHLSSAAVFLFLRRSPRWRRFDRAMRKVRA